MRRNPSAEGFLEHETFAFKSASSKEQSQWH